MMTFRYPSMKIRTILLLLPLLLPLIQGCTAMAYPFARAFGSPSESELKQYRSAFARLQAGRLIARIVVYPATDPVGLRQEAYTGSAELMTEQLRAKGWTNCTTTSTPPPVEASPLGHNQLRYAWNRAHAYGQWVKTTRPEGDFHLFVEILSSSSNNIIGIHCYVLDAAGQVAYERLLNSHHFGRNTPRDAEAACQLILRGFLNNIDQPAERIFPAYGVG